MVGVSKSQSFCYNASELDEFAELIKAKGIIHVDIPSMHPDNKWKKEISLPVKWYRVESNMSCFVLSIVTTNEHLVYVTRTAGEFGGLEFDRAKIIIRNTVLKHLRKPTWCFDCKVNNKLTRRECSQHDIDCFHSNVIHPFEGNV